MASPIWINGPNAVGKTQVAWPLVRQARQLAVQLRHIRANA
jgi:hypothetical protein